MAREYHHGNTPAAWTGVLIAFVGFGVGGAFTVMAQPLGVAAGAVIVALGGVVGLIMRSMGLGQPPAQAPAHRPGAGTATVPAQSAAPDSEAEQATVGG
ncbi:HGxxPAAW family protein [Streptomyces sp. DSM 44917]|uniref:HGxxPAAW family protein n=1 Tax=Streptomyces boetiae TaxID=3075541 RepID=A0ABU2L513_9ACTN|nr:HGxxPAAW family protein [Streptomyces sp. DSM 44917]MDT0306646.1 HGxxPAAW family protein [Streptomyces sp. DSM 44917]